MMTLGGESTGPWALTDANLDVFLFLRSSPSPATHNRTSAWTSTLVILWSESGFHIPCGSVGKSNASWVVTADIIAIAGHGETSALFADTLDARRIVTRAILREN